MLQLKRAELEDRVVEEQERLARVERHLRAIEQETEMPPDIVLKSIPELRVAAVKCKRPVSGFDEVPHSITPAVLRLITAIDRGRVKPTGPMFVYYEDGPDGSLEPVAAVPIGGAPLPPGDQVVEVVLPPVEVAAAVHEGTPDHTEGGPVYAHLHQWAHDHGYSSTGRGRNLILKVPDGDGQGLFEHQLPLGEVSRSSPADGVPSPIRT